MIPDATTSWKDRPKAIREVQRRLDQVARGERWLPLLDEAPVYVRGRRFERRRNMRSERVKACMGLLQRFAEYVSLASRIVWHHPTDGIIGRRLADVAEELDFSDRRIDRAMRDLAAVGYVLSAERAEFDPATARYRGIAAIRQFSHKLIEDLGLAELWAKWSKAHYRRQQKRQAQGQGKKPYGAQPQRRPRSERQAQSAPVRISTALAGKLGPPGRSS